MTGRPTTPVPGPLTGTDVSVPTPGRPKPRAQEPRAQEPRKLRWRLAFGVALAVQLVAVYSPHGLAGPGITGLDKVVHVSIFFAPSLALLMMGIRARWALGILALHAPVSELIQHFFLPERSGDVFDVLADLSGVALGWFAYVVWDRRHP
jgi:VanZ family protein